MAKNNIRIEKTDGAPETVALLARSVVQVSDAASRILKMGLTERALIVLLHDAIGAQNISKRQIRLVLNNLPRLKAWYCRKADE